MIDIPITILPDEPTDIQIRQDIDLLMVAGIVYRVDIQVAQTGWPYRVRIQQMDDWRQFEKVEQGLAYIRSMAP